MNEKFELQELNKQMTSCINAIERIEVALIGDKFNNKGHSGRIDLIEKKLEKIEKYFWVLIGMFSLGTIPIGNHLLPILKSYFKN